MLSFAKRVAVVTGAGSVGPGWGNGKATAALFARQGASVFAIDINEDAARETQSVIEDGGGICIVHRCDMLDSEAVRAAVKNCVARLGRIDVLVNNVGGSHPGDPVEMSETIWDQYIDYNLKTAFLGCKHVLPVMEAQGAGVVVNISSVIALRMYTDRVTVGYTASKAGVIAFSKSVALAYVKKGIRCNTVVPGLMHTPLVERRLTGQLGADAEALIAKRHAQVPMGRMGDAWDVANAVLFLASDEARYITATELVVDGGLTSAAP
jgi:NAD(P)-dependent dehydrogenase (short-subunit alcohol dehydrogenase family)